MPGPGGKPARPSLGRVLVADDKPENLLLLSTFLKREGYEPVTVRDGREAVRACEEAPPDLIIMDAAMPGMDGFEATREIRRRFPHRWIPILFLSAYSGVESQTRGLEAGGDDYLAKPVNLPILAEKLKAMRRIAAVQQKLADYATQLEDSLHRARAEEEFARHLVEHITGREGKAEEGLAQWIRPAAQFSGDVLVHARGPAGERYLLVADATGHGLAAAISVLPLVEAFQRLAEKGYSVAFVVTELNRKSRRLLPRDRFVAAVVAAVDENAQSLQLWNGGLPEALFMDEGGRVVRTWPSRHPPLGVLPEEDFQGLPEVFSWSTPGQLIVHTDGLNDVRDAHGQPLVGARLQGLLAGAPPERRLAALQEIVDAFPDTAGIRDDITIALLDCPLAKPSPAPCRENQGTGAADGAAAWRVAVRLDGAELARLDLVPMLMSWLDQLGLETSSRGPAFTVLSELVNNAIDHGLLELDSALKHRADGFERYVEARTERLARLTTGWVEISIERRGEGEESVLDITVADSGKGFDHEAFLNAAEETDTLPSGRGIRLVRRIARQLRYEGAGNRVSARLAWAAAAKD